MSPAKPPLTGKLSDEQAGKGAGRFLPLHLLGSISNKRSVLVVGEHGRTLTAGRGVTEMLG